MGCLIVFISVFVCVIFGQSHGPVFLLEPPTHLTFSNTTGSQVSCSAHGSPSPKVEWILQDRQLVTAVPGLRQSLGNGTLYFPPFRAQDYRKDVHSTVYRCRASNSAGTIISRQVNVRAVVNQHYEIQVHHTHVIYGNTAVLVCVIPAFVREYVMVTSWARDDRILLPGPNMGGKLLVTYGSNELHVRGVKLEDSQNRYSCITLHELTQERKRSQSVSLTVTEPKGSMPPRLTPTVQTTVAAERESDIHLRCSAQGNPAPSFDWFREIRGGLEPIRSSSKYEISQDVLLIRKVKVEDGGRWTCKVFNRFGEQKLDIQLTVTAHLSVHMLPQLQVINAGDVAMFNCTVSGLPVGSVEWVKDGKPLNVDTRVSLLTPLILSISSVNRHDRGMYQCIVYNDRESCQGSAELRIGDTVPEMQYTFIEQALQPGPPVSLRCSATGSPPPQFQWLLDGVPILDIKTSHRYLTGQYVNQAGDVVTHLNISNVRPEDGGLYSCRAFNLLGSVEHAARLNVYGSPAIRSIGPIKAVAGTNVTIYCPYSGYPVDSILWEKRGQDLSFDHRHRLTTLGSLTITNLVPSVDSGFYTCIVTNRNEQMAKKEIQLVVNSPPILEPFKFPDNLQEGEHAQATCFVTSGDKPVHFTWLKDGFPITPTLQVEEQTAEFYTILIFKEVSAKHSGAYTCVARNSAAKTNYTAHLLVKVSPYWVNEPQDRSALLDNSVLINCEAQGSPQPQIEWFKGSDKSSNDYQPLINIHDRLQLLNNKSLWTEKIASHHEGYYLCKATNGVGSGISKSIFLQVNEPPKFDIPVKNISVAKFSSVSLPCNVYGDVPITITWTLDGRKLISSNNLKITKTDHERGVKSQILLNRATRANTGVYKCFAENIFGKGQQIINLLVQEPPSSPTMLEIIEVASRSLRLAWQRPYNGNNPIQSYLIQYKPIAIPSNQWQKIEAKNVTIPLHSLILDNENTERETTVINGLIPSTTYSLRLSAVNSISHSAFSDPIIARTQEEAPSSAPTDIQVESISPDELFVSWSVPPRETWNGELIGYTVIWKEQGKSVSESKFVTVKGWATTKLQLVGLKKFTQYEINVRAVNNVAEGPSSVTIVGITKEGTPEDAPRNITCSHITFQSIKVSWLPPPDEKHGGIIQGYKVYYRPIQQNIYAPAVGEIKRTSHSETYLHGLQKYTNYSIKILAYTGAGDGILSLPIYCVTEEDVPGPPADIKAAALTAESVLISWLPPTKPNGRIIYFTVYVQLLGRIGKYSSYNVHTEEANVTNTLLYEVRNIVEHESYEFWVTATTSIGEGEPTSIVSCKPNSKAPSRIASFSQILRRPIDSDALLVCVAVGNPTPSTRWTDSRGHPIISGPFYEVTSNGHLNIFKLSEGSAGNYTCVAKNLFGEDEITYAVIVLLPPSVPMLEVQYTTTRSVKLRWTQPESDESSVQGYTLKIRTDTNDWTTLELSPERKTYTLNGLRCGTVYHICLLAHNRVGNGSPSSILTIKTKGGPPQLPKEEKLIQTNSSFLQLNLDTWPNGGCTISHFSVHHRIVGKTDWNLVSTSVSEEKLTVQGLLSATWYQLQIIAYNEAGATKGLFYFATRTLSGDTILMPSSFADDTLSINEETVSKETFFTTSIITFLIGIVIFLAVCLFIVCSRVFKKGVASDEIAEEVAQSERTLEECSVKMANRGDDCSLKTKDQESLSPVGMYEISPYATFSVPENTSYAVNAATLDYNVRFKTFGHKEIQDMDTGCLKKNGKYLRRHDQGRNMIRDNSESEDTSESAGGECSRNNNFRQPVSLVREAETLPISELYRPGSSTESNEMSPTLDKRRNYRQTGFHKRHLIISNRHGRGPRTKTEESKVEGAYTYTEI